MRLKDYPRQIVIKDSIWDVKFVKKLNGHGRMTIGLCDPSDQTISVRLGLDKRERMKTLIHEIFHAWEEEYGLHIPHKLIYALEDPVVDFIIDNHLFG